jgi:hypothetical protein
VHIHISILTKVELGKGIGGRDKKEIQKKIEIYICLDASM